MTPLMARDEYAHMRRAEDRHWWYRALHRLVARHLRRAGLGARPAVLLDAGCGTGGGLSRWSRIGGARCVGSDLAAVALDHCRERGHTLLVQGSVERLPFDDRAFDALVSLDVLCLDGVDAAGALSEFHRVLRAGGLLVVNVPAFASLRGEHDVAVRIGRRFARSELAALVRDAGFDVVEVRYWNSILWPVVWLTRRWRRSPSGAPPRSDVTELPWIVNAALSLLLRIEEALPAVERIPFGTSAMCAARRP